MDYLMQMSVEEQTLYKKWVELQEDNMLRDKSTKHLIMIGSGNLQISITKNLQSKRLRN